MKTILITGAAGFIGSNLANHLFSMGYHLVLVDSLEYGGDSRRLNESIRKDLIVDNLMSTERMTYVSNVDLIIHLAAISSLPANEKDPLASIRNNFISTVNLYEAGVKYKVSQFYFSSTSAVYENNEVVPFDEEMRVSPDLFYSYSKKITEDYLQVRSNKKDGLITTVLRFFNVFGNGQNTLRLNPPLTGYLVDQILADKTATLYNNSDVKRDYIHVKDVFQIIEKLIASRKENFKKYEVLNLCSGNTYSVPDIITILESVAGKKLMIEYKNPADIWSNHDSIFSKVTKKRVEGEVFKKSIGSNAKLLKILGNDFHFIDMSEGLREMYKEGLILL